MDTKVLNEYKKQAVFRMDESTRMIRLSFDFLSEANVWKRPHTNGNSIGNLILHLCGNITQYAISSLGQLEDHRNRDAEFEAQTGLTKSQLLDTLIHTVEEAKKTILNTASKEYLREREVQGFTFSGIGIVMHVVEHYSYHTGQIAFWIKQLTQQKDLGFYADMDLTIKNKD